MSNIYHARTRFKQLFLLLLLLLTGLFLYISHQLVQDLGKEEEHKMEIWAEATREFASQDNGGNVNLILKVIQSNTTIPVIITDSTNAILGHLNIDFPKGQDQEKVLKERLEQMKSRNKRIEIYLDEAYTQYLYYEDSTLLKRLFYYPYIQMGTMLLFFVILYFALISTKKAEQNKVWVGLSKETAHQLGTPISSLMAWVEVLRMNNADQDIVMEMEKDVSRLSVIADRFSKIGSKPELVPTPFTPVLENAVQYIQRRCSNRVKITMNNQAPDEVIQASVPLLEWVIENICKNAIDAMNGQGDIYITLYRQQKTLILEIRDTGKGISKKAYKTIFSPGYTTKNRGWGLGLTLVKRIIEEYHKGKIYVKTSEINKGTTFAIELPVSEQ